MTKINLSSVHADSSAASYCDFSIVHGVTYVGKAAVGPRRRLIKFGRATHVHSLMGPLIVVFQPEGIELLLLLEQVLSRGLRGFILKRVR